ncbi:MAG: EF-P lysine aminoacylase EpmA [Acidobacteriota bacterium]
MSWRPAASLDSLRRRAAVIRAVRAFFEARGALEVETPLLAGSPVTDLHLESVSCRLELGGEPRDFYLQTSPEFAMKRLLAAGSGPIFQIAKAVRDGELGARHNPEFTMLEWYRPGWDHHRLMDEVDALVREVLGSEPAERLTYGEAFLRHVGIDPHGATAGELAEAAALSGLGEIAGLDAGSPVDDWLHALMSLRVEPRLGRGGGEAAGAVFLYDYPASQAALARVRPGSPPVAERFELYVRGVELANGFHELTDAAEQRRRFEGDLAERRRRGLETPPVDERLLAALEAGLPPCAGVALGVDRLVMLAVGASSLDQVLAFPANRA